MKHPAIIIVGGGAAGIMSALIAAKLNAKVTILEKNPRIGRKILTTGNGRCNYTNTLASASSYNHPEFATPALAAFGPKDCVAFFRQLGIEPRVEARGRTYPYSEQASSFLDVFLYELKRLGVNIVVDCEVKNVTRQDHGFVVFATEGRQYEADKVILATGGKAMPSSGSTGSGYVLAESLGHRITRIFPALVKLRLDSPYLKHLDGVKIQGSVELLADNRVIDQATGDILFTAYGISGPTILDLSRKANEALDIGADVRVKVILVDNVDTRQIRERFMLNPEKPVDLCLVGLVNKRLISPILKECGISKHTESARALSEAEISKIGDLLLGWQFSVLGSKSFEDAQVTAGGVEITDLNPQTLESRIINDLYFAGEIIDIDGPCGGFNLQWAWSSGHVAGANAAKNTKP